MNTNIPSPEDAIEQLRRDWPGLSPVDRARAVRKINLSGTSIRGIARGLGCSDASLRHLLKILDAPGADLAAARQGSISINELVRRAKAAAMRREKKKSEARQIEHKRKAMETSKTIRGWLEQENLSGSRGEAIALEARSKLISDYGAGKLPRLDPRIVHPAAEWIERCRPQTPVPEDISYIDWYAVWLARWSYCLCRRAELAIDTLAIAGKL